MCSGQVVLAAAGLGPDVELRLAVVGDGEGHQGLGVHLAVAERGQELRGDGREAHHLGDLALADARAGRDLGRRHALGPAVARMPRTGRPGASGRASRSRGGDTSAGSAAAVADSARRDVPGGDLAGLGELLQGGQPPAAGDHGEGVVAVGGPPGGSRGRPATGCSPAAPCRPPGRRSPFARWRTDSVRRPRGMFRFVSFIISCASFRVGSAGPSRLRSGRGRRRASWETE